MKAPGDEEVGQPSKVFRKCVRKRLRDMDTHHFAPHSWGPNVETLQRKDLGGEEWIVCAAPTAKEARWQIAILFKHVLQSVVRSETELYAALERIEEGTGSNNSDSPIIAFAGIPLPSYKEDVRARSIADTARTICAMLRAGGTLDIGDASQTST